MTTTTPLRCFILAKNEFRSVIYEEDIAVSLLHALVERLPERATPQPYLTDSRLDKGGHAKLPFWLDMFRKEPPGSRTRATADLQGLGLGRAQ